MTPAEFQAIAQPLAKLEDYLRDMALQSLGERSIEWEYALRLAIAAHAQAQLLAGEDKP